MLEPDRKRWVYLRRHRILIALRDRQHSSKVTVLLLHLKSNLSQSVLRIECENKGRKSGWKSYRQTTHDGRSHSFSLKYRTCEHPFFLYLILIHLSIIGTILTWNSVSKSAFIVYVSQVCVVQTIQPSSLLFLFFIVCKRIHDFLSSFLYYKLLRAGFTKLFSFPWGCFALRLARAWVIYRGVFRIFKSTATGMLHISENPYLTRHFDRIRCQLLCYQANANAPEAISFLETCFTMSAPVRHSNSHSLVWGPIISPIFGFWVSESAFHQKAAVECTHILILDEIWTFFRNFILTLKRLWLRIHLKNFLCKFWRWWDLLLSWKVVGYWTRYTAHRKGQQQQHSFDLKWCKG